MGHFWPIRCIDLVVRTYFMKNQNRFLAKSDPSLSVYRSRSIKFQYSYLRLRLDMDREGNYSKVSPCLTNRKCRSWVVASRHRARRRNVSVKSSPNSSPNSSPSAGAWLADIRFRCWLVAARRRARRRASRRVQILVWPISNFVVGSSPSSSPNPSPNSSPSAGAWLVDF